MIRALYYRLLNALGLMERRCGWCKKWMGWKRGVMPPGPPAGLTPVTHGICGPCKIKVEAEEPAKQALGVAAPTTPVKHQHRSRRTFRRRTGGWGGAVAI
jgi:hypothetical protein